MGCNPSLGKVKIFRGDKESRADQGVLQRPPTRKATVHVGMNPNKFEEAKHLGTFAKQVTVPSTEYSGTLPTSKNK
ncbi:unnamed protein product [Blepharisma stoltei]|uniref:Uncharacterized protein n=1 Tax=Blepharisma stoltei TaxID=1481888 RepID=A0AAU9KFP8_9CILI|nr:unnamed protein product [Blepharisma stoltei]